MSNKYAEYLAFARLASWLNFPVGVLEDVNSRVFTLIVKLPMCTLQRRIPSNQMHGFWIQIMIEPEEKVVDVSRDESALLDLARSDLIRTIRIHKGYSKHDDGA